MFYDSTFLILIPAIIFAFLAQNMIKSNYKKFSAVESRLGYTGADIARALLNSQGIKDVEVLPVQGNLTDHYDPRVKKVMLSEGVYNSASIAAISVAAHETGHAVQHYNGYVPLGIRSAIVPVANFGSSAAVPVFILGMFLGNSGMVFMNLGILLFLGAVIFQFVTLPVEFNASKRAIGMLEGGNYLTREEIVPAKKVLNAAAMTYVASALMTVAQLLRLIMLSGRRK